MLHKTLKLLAGAALLLPVLAVSAMAQDDPNIVFPSGNAKFTDGFESETVHVAGAGGGLSTSIGVSAGGFGATNVSPAVTNAVGLFWCTDLADGLSLNYNYNQYPLTQSNPGAKYPSNPPSSTQAAQITNILYNQEANGSNASALSKFTTGSANQSIWSAATQMAIWAVLYDTSTTGYNITQGSGQNFTVNNTTGDASTAITDANTLLSCVASGTSCPSGWGATPGTYGASNFIPLTQGGSQSLALLTQGSGSQSAPEPSSLAMLAAALLGFALIRVRAARR